MKVKVKFKEFIGLAGDPHILLFGLSDTGARESKLFKRVGILHSFRLKRAKKRIIKKLNKVTGLKHIEHGK